MEYLRMHLPYDGVNLSLKKKNKQTSKHLRVLSALTTVFTISCSKESWRWQQWVISHPCDNSVYELKRLRALLFRTNDKIPISTSLMLCSNKHELHLRFEIAAVCYPVPVPRWLISDSVPPQIVQQQNHATLELASFKALTLRRNPRSQCRCPPYPRYCQFQRL